MESRTEGVSIRRHHYQLRGSLHVDLVRHIPNTNSPQPKVLVLHFPPCPPFFSFRSAEQGNTNDFFIYYFCSSSQFALLCLISSSFVVLLAYPVSKGTKSIYILRYSSNKEDFTYLLLVAPGGVLGDLKNTQLLWVLIDVSELC